MSEPQWVQFPNPCSGKARIQFKRCLERAQPGGCAGVEKTQRIQAAGGEVIREGFQEEVAPD